MANQYYNFSYNPGQEGFDNSSWHKVYGDVLVVADQLVLNKAAIIHYGDILRCDAVFSLDISAPADGDNNTFGLIQYAKGEHAYFKISDTTFTAETSNGVDQTSVVITWQPSWSGTNSEYRIKWEGGMVKFFVNGVQQAIINDVSVSGDPMSLYLASDTSNTFLLNYIIVKSIQSFVMSQGNENSSFGMAIKESDKLGISELVTASMAANLAINKADSLNVSEDKIVVRPELIFTQTVDDSLDITDGIMAPSDIEVVGP